MRQRRSRNKGFPFPMSFRSAAYEPSLFTPFTGNYGRALEQAQLILGYTSVRAAQNISSIGERNTMSTGSTSSIAFGALGTLLGYVGAEVASDAVFSRLLWPQRFYNTNHPRDLILFVVLMPMGGPMHKAAIAVLDSLIASGLNKGYCRGDMLGTTFYEDVRQKYALRRGLENDNELQKEARNGLWIRVLRLVNWQAMEKHHTQQISEKECKDEEAADQVIRLRAKRPLFWLTLGYDINHSNQGSDRRHSHPPVHSATLSPLVEEKSTIWQKHVLLGIIMSETISLGVVVFVASYWRSPFSVWFLSPLLVKLLGLIFSVRRQALQTIPERTASARSQEADAGQDSIICEMCDFSKGFFMIEGPRNLVMQFFKHYGHPERFRRGLNGDRNREVVCLALIVVCILIYPAGLVAFVFAPQRVQWTWLGYQLYTTFAMHLFRFSDGGAIGSTESELARFLGKKKSVRFRDAAGNTIRADLDLTVVVSIADSRTAIDERLDSVRSQ